MKSRTYAGLALLGAILVFAAACSNNSSNATLPISAMGVQGASTTTPFTSFDIIFADAGSQLMSLSSRSTKLVSVYDVSSDTLLGGTATVFSGVGADNPHSGPNGNLIAAGHNEIWAADYNSAGVGVPAGTDCAATLASSACGGLVRVFDLSASKSAPPQIAVIPVGGTLRADEMDYDSKDDIVVVASDVDAFVTFISRANKTILGTLTFDGTNGTLDATQGGLGAVLFNSNTGRILVSIPQIGSDPTKGAVAEVDPVSRTVTNNFVGLDNCAESGMALGPGGNVLVGCDPGAPTATAPGNTLFSPLTYVINGATGAVVAKITQVGGEDEVWYNPGDNRYYTASRDFFTDPNATSASPVLGVIDAASNKWIENVPTATNSHAVTANPKNNHIYVPLRSGTTQCGSLPGCVGIFFVLHGL